MIRNYKNILFCLALIGTAINSSPSFAEESRLDKMVSPAFNAVNFEDPRAISEARFLYYYHKIDNEFVTAGGDAQLYALQLRYAITEKLSFIATKDGYVDFNPKSNVPKDQGFADLEAGLKYSFIENKESGYILSGQLRYLIPVGEKEVFQGNGDGMIHPSISSAYGITEALTVTSATGLRIPVTSNDSMFWDLDVQLDYRIDLSDDGLAIYPLVGASLVHVASGGERLGIADEGQDLFNFGATKAGGNNILTGIGGFRLRTGKYVDLGLAYQIPLDRSEGSRIIDYRWNFDLIVRF